MDSEGLHIRTPGLIDVLCDIEAMAVWELLRSARAGRSAEEAAGLASLSLTRIRLILERLIALKLVEARPAGRGRRLTTYRVTVPELLVSHDGIPPETKGEMLTRWSESRLEYFNRALRDGVLPDRPAPDGFCDSSALHLSNDEYSRLKSLIHQISVLLQSAGRHPRCFSQDDSAVNKTPCAVLIRLQHLHAIPLPAPTVAFGSGSAVSSNGQHRIDRGTLAPRERQVAEALAGGMSRPEIANQLQLSVHTVATMSKRVYRKLGIRNRAELVRVMMT